MPTAPEKINANTTAFQEINKGHPAVVLRSCEPASPTPIPTIPPLRLRVSASTRNCHKLSFCLAPTARRIPISRVRSVTETSIMNIMLVSVTERTREIGIRLAVGAKQKDILWQFLVEALTLSLSGGMVGIGVGLAGSQLLSTTAGWPLLISWNAVVLALIFSGAVGIFFGFYPARKAAQLDPIQALRYE